MYWTPFLFCLGTTINIVDLWFPQVRKESPDRPDLVLPLCLYGSVLPVLARVSIVVEVGLHQHFPTRPLFQSRLGDGTREVDLCR